MGALLLDVGDGPAAEFPLDTTRIVPPGTMEVDFGRVFAGVTARVAAGVPGAVGGFAALSRCSVLIGNFVLLKGTSGSE